MNKLFLLTAIILVALTIAAKANERGVLKSPYPVFITTPAHPSLDAVKAKCPKTPPPPP